MCNILPRVLDIYPTSHQARCKIRSFNCGRGCMDSKLIRECHKNAWSRLNSLFLRYLRRQAMKSVQQSRSCLGVRPTLLFPQGYWSESWCNFIWARTLITQISRVNFLASSFFFQVFPFHTLPASHYISFFTLFFTLSRLHFFLYTFFLHFPDCISFFTLFFTLSRLHFFLYTFSTLFRLHFFLYTFPIAFLSLHFPDCISFFTLFFTLSRLHFFLYTFFYTFPIAFLSFYFPFKFFVFTH